MTSPAIGRPCNVLLAAATMARLAVNTVPIALVLLAVLAASLPFVACLVVAAFGGFAAGRQLLSAVPLLSAPGRESLERNERVASPTSTT